MGKSKDLTLPEPPKYQTDPNYKQGVDSLQQYGNQLSSGDLSGNLSWLQPLLNNNNSANALAAAQGVLQPQFRDTLAQIKNEAAANGQLESSTFTDALARSQSDLNSKYQSIVSSQAINDNNLNNQNRLNLFGTGLNTIGQVTTFGQNNQNSENQFNLSNYDNLVAQAIQNNKNANKQNGWQQFGAMVAPMVGGGLGSLVGGPAGAMVGSQLGSGLYGGFTDQGSQGSQSADIMKILSSFGGGTFSSGNVPGSGMFGSSLGGRTQSEMLGFDTSQYKNYLNN